MTWPDMSAQFLDELRHEGCAETTIVAYRPWLKRFVEFCTAEGIHTPAACTADDVNRWRARLNLRPNRKGSLYSPLTVDLALRAVRGMFRWALAHEQLLLDPTAQLVLPHLKRTTRPAPTLEDLERMLAVPDRDSATGMRDLAVLEALYTTGMRRSECHALSLADLDLDMRTLRLRGKAGRERMVPVGDRLAQTLERYLEHARPRLLEMGERRRWMDPHVLPDPHEPALFVSQAGTRYGLPSIDALVRRTMHRAGVQGAASPHRLRHAFASHMLEGGAEMHEVQRLMGHASPNTTYVYTHVSTEELCRVHRETHPRAQRQTPPAAMP